MRKLIVFPILMFILCTVVYAIEVRQNVVLDDGFYTYTVNTDFTVDDIKVNSGEIYFDDIPFCEWEERYKLTTERSCDGEPPPVVPEFSTITMVLALTLIVLVFLIIRRIKK